MRQHCRWRIWLPITLILLTLLFIWSNSARDAAASSAQSDAVGHWIQRLFDTTREPFRSLYTHRRKVAHFVEFALLGAECGWGLWLNKAKRLSCFGGLALCVIAAVVDETIQLFSLGRVSSILDVCLDTAGALFGLLMMLALRALARVFAKK